MPEPVELDHSLSSDALAEHLSATRAARGLLPHDHQVRVGDLWDVDGRRLRVLDVSPNNARVDEAGRPSYLSLRVFRDRGRLLERGA